jgi:hypothetical protein
LNYRPGVTAYKESQVGGTPTQHQDLNGGTTYTLEIKEKHSGENERNNLIRVLIRKTYRPKKRSIIISRIWGQPYGVSGSTKVIGCGVELVFHETREPYLYPVE